MPTPAWGRGSPSGLSFRLEGTLPSNLADLSGYRYRFVDAIPSGIGMVPDSHRVTLVRPDGTTVDLTGCFSMSYDGDSKAVTISCDDILGLSIGVSQDDRIVATYDFRLVDGASQGLATGNPSFAHIEWAELGDDGRGTTYKTVDDGANVYTYGIVITKVAEDSGKALGDASFRIGDGSGRWMSDAGWTEDASKARILTTGDDGTTRLPLLDGGDLVISETQAPSGYAKADDIPISIDATLDGQRALTATSPVAGTIERVDSGTGVIACSVKDSPDTGATDAPGTPTQAGENPPGDEPSEAPSAPAITPSSISSATGKVIGAIAGRLLQMGSDLANAWPPIAIGIIGLLAVTWLRRRRRG